MSNALISDGYVAQVRFRTFHLVDQWDCPQRIVAAYFIGETKEMEGGPETTIYCQFSFCSPQEKESSRSRGRFIAMQRLMSKNPDRGRMSFNLPTEAGFSALNNGLKRCAIMVAKKKCIRWVNGYSETDLV